MGARQFQDRGGSAGSELDRARKLNDLADPEAAGQRFGKDAPGPTAHVLGLCRERRDGVCRYPRDRHGLGCELLGGDAGVSKEAALDVGRNAPGRLPGSAPLFDQGYHLRHQTRVCFDISKSLSKCCPPRTPEAVRWREVSMTATFPPPFVGGRNADAPFSRSSRGRVLPPVLAPVAPFWRFATPASIGRIGHSDPYFHPRKRPFGFSFSVSSDFCNPSDERESHGMPLEWSRLRRPKSGFNSQLE